VLDGVYRTSEGGPVFHEVPAPTVKQLQALLVKIITRIMKLLTRLGALIEEQGLTYLAEIDAHSALTPLQTASCTYRIALGPRAGQKVLGLQAIPPRLEQSAPPLYANLNGFSLHAAVRCRAGERQKLEHLCRYITRPALANGRLTCNPAGQVVLRLKTAYRNGTTHIVLSPLEFMQRLAAPAPASDPLSWRARSARQVACRDRADSCADDCRAPKRWRARACAWRSGAHALGALAQARVRD
jgi:Putative transposase